MWQIHDDGTATRFVYATYCRHSTGILLRRKNTPTYSKGNVTYVDNCDKLLFYLMSGAFIGTQRLKTSLTGA